MNQILLVLSDEEVTDLKEILRAVKATAYPTDSQDIVLGKVLDQIDEQR